MEQRQLQIQRLHQRIREYQPTSQQLRYLQRTHSELQSAIQQKYTASKTNSHYKFPLLQVTEPSLHDVDPCGTVYNLHQQNFRRGAVGSALDRIRTDSSLERESLGRRVLAVAEGRGAKRNVGSAVAAAAKRLKTEGGESLNKENVPYKASKKSKLNSTQSKLTTNQLATSKPTKKPRKSQHRKKAKDLRLTLHDSADALNLTSKIHPTSTSSNKLRYDFTQSYKFQGISKLNQQRNGNCNHGDRLSDYSNSRNKLELSLNKKKEQFPYEKMYNDVQMKLLTNRMSQEGKSVKSNYRLMLEVEGQTPTNQRQIPSRFTNR